MDEIFFLHRTGWCCRAELALPWCLLWDPVQLPGGNLFTFASVFARPFALLARARTTSRIHASASHVDPTEAPDDADLVVGLYGRGKHERDGRAAKFVHVEGKRQG